MVIDFQIKEQYETYNRSPEEIAINENLDIVAVKAKLLVISEKYRSLMGKEEENPDDFTTDQLRAANSVIYENMLQATLPDGSVDYRTRQRAAEYIRDDKKGRKELRNLLKGGTFNLLQFNGALEGARNRAEQAKSNMPKMVEV